MLHLVLIWNGSVTHRQFNFLLPMTVTPASLVVHVQPHRSRYRLHDRVKCHLTLHTVRTLEAHHKPSNSTSDVPSKDRASTTSATIAGSQSNSQSMIPYDQSRLYAETTRSNSSQSSLTSSIVHVHQCSVQLVAYCCWDRKKLTITDDAMRKVAHMPVVSVDLTKKQTTVGSASVPELAEATRLQLQAPEVVGRNETVTVQHLSKVARPFEGMRFHLGETSTAAVMLVLPPSNVGHTLMMPSYRGHSLRTSFMVVVSVTWSASFTNGSSSTNTDNPSASANTTTTTLRIPLRVHSPEAVLPGRLVVAPLFSSDDEDDDEHHAASSNVPPTSNASPLADDDGSWVAVPSASSPALCPPLHDTLVQEMSPTTDYLRSRALGIDSAASGGGVVDEGSGSNSSLIVSTSHSIDAQLRQGIAATTSCGPTDYIIRYQGAHVMNFFLESSMVTLGGNLCGTFIAVPGAALRVARITLSIDSIELVGRPFVAKGASVTSSTPEMFASVVPPQFPERVPVQAHTVEEREWYVLDAQHMPMDLCLSPMKFQQTIRTPLASLEWVARWKFWCVDALSAGQINALKRPLKEVYQELELPLTICPPREGAAAARMGPVTIGV